MFLKPSGYTMNPNNVLFRMLEGQCVNQYQLKKLLGTGAFGGVYSVSEVVQDTEISKRALKLILTGDHSKQLRELQAALNLSHDHLLRSYTCGQCRLLEHNFLYLLMELADYSLQAYFEEKQLLTETETQQVLEHVAKALYFLHAQGYVHRDIKPGNILWIASQQRWKVSDLGLITELSQGSLAMSSSGLGTILFMPPEAFETGREGKAQISTGWDTWALGIMTILLVTGKYPYQHRNELELLGAIYNYELQIPPNLPQSLVELIRGCLKRDRQHRWSAEQVLQALQSQHVGYQDLSLSINRPTGNVDKHMTDVQIPQWLQATYYKANRFFNFKTIFNQFRGWLMGETPPHAPYSQRWKWNSQRWKWMAGTTAVLTIMIPFTVFTVKIAFLSLTGEEACFEDVKNLPQGVFTHGGSTTWASIRAELDKSSLSQVSPEFQLRYTHPTREEGEAGSHTGIQMLLNGRLSFAETSRPLNQDEKNAARARGFELKQESVALDPTVFVVHPSLEIPGLRLQQLREIYTGQIRNWQQVGGPDQPITTYLHPSAKTGWFKSFILRNNSPHPDTVWVKNTTEGLRLVARDPGGIYDAAAIQTVPQCTVRPIPVSETSSGGFVAPYLETLTFYDQCIARPRRLNQAAFKTNYPFTRNLYVITKEFQDMDTLEERAGEAFVRLLKTDEGQRLIEQAGFVAIGNTTRACTRR